MTIKKKKIIKVAIDSPAAAGAGTQAKLISKHYNFYKYVIEALKELVGSGRNEEI